ncbi:MAG: prepilin peptidase [Candidatus Sungbacteria bacterium]|uniref:Prepilin peptidase n=1 Tax=Candidatus Sungiibacteriota bacterium TaxID=2750080 RepID=A0A932YWQ1_9BACT|nr:prepilin peptidase [Candidatus Sungbacteria bacterium]
MAVLAFTLAAFGLAAGSFLNALASRLATGESVFSGRSHCVHCGRTLAWFELIPLGSFLIQRGRCRSCGGAIPVRYFIVELFSAALFLLLGLRIFQGTLSFPFVSGSPDAFIIDPLLFQTGVFLYYGAFLFFGLLVSVYDFEHRLILSRPIWLLALMGLLGHASAAVLTRNAGPLVWAAGIAAGAFFFFWSLWFFSRGRAMGRGDADVAGAIALYLGPAVALIGLLLAFWTGALTGLLLLGAGVLRWKSRIPFAPFLFFGATLALFFSESAYRLLFSWS